MKRSLSAWIFISVLILFACCTGPSDNSGAAAKSELLAAFTSQSSEYSASYLLTISSSAREHSQEMDYYILGNDHVRIDSRVGSGADLQESRVYFIGNRSTVCSLNGSVWSCSTSELEKGIANSYEASQQKMANAISTANVKKLPDRMVAGVNSKCYNLTGSTSGMPWDYLYCISERGVPLYVVGNSNGVLITQEAVKYSNNVSSSDYALPSEQKANSSRASPYQSRDKKTFQDTGDALCTENGKPVVRMFSTTWCTHCKYIKSTFDETLKKYVEAGRIVAHHWELDTSDDTLTPEKETAVPDTEKAVFDKYNPGESIPTYVFGCKYLRIGNGYESSKDLEAEKKEFEDLIEEISS